MRTRLPLPIALSCVFATLFVAAAAHAQNDPFARDIDTIVFKPTPLGNSGITLEGGQLPEERTFQAGFLLDANVGLLPLYRGNDRLGQLIPFRLDGHLFASVTAHRLIEVGLHLPVTLYQQDRFSLLAAEGFPQPGIAAAGIGDLRIVPRLAILQRPNFPVGLSLITELRVPTGNGQSFLGDRTVVFAPRLAVDAKLGIVRILANLGMRIRGPGRFLNLVVWHEYVAGLGVQVDLPEFWFLKRPVFTAETQLATQTTAPFTFSNAAALKTPWEVLAGLRFGFAEHWGAELDIGRGITGVSVFGREDFRILGGIRFDWDFSGKKSSPVEEKPKDTTDRDGDGIYDVDDRCPDDPEDHDFFQDDDGCPEADNDKDGLDDLDDACPNDAGPKANQGCPLRDRDKDSLYDEDDVCPDDAGPVENGGCPTDRPNVELSSNKIRLRGTVLFETGKDIIRPQSFPLLNEVYTVLAKNPTVGPIRVDGHTDNRGSRPYNMDLSRRRARAVMNHLIDKGISSKRLSFEGFGFDKPVAENDTPEGRQRNRRVEFTVQGQSE